MNKNKKKKLVELKIQIQIHFGKNIHHYSVIHIW